MNEQYPLVSCLMVTRAANMKIIDNAIFSYTIQTYKNKELVIITDCDSKNLDDLKCLLDKYNDNSIRIVYLKEKLKMGALRNASINNALGEYCIQWDDDDLYHSDRIEKQYFELISGDYDYCLLKDFMMYFYNTHILSMNTWFNDKMVGKPPTIMFRKNMKYRYPDHVQFGEDIEIFNTTNLKPCILYDMPHLYIYTYHGYNSYDYEHYLNLYNHTKVIFNRDILEKVTPLLDYACLDYRF
jgi:glycosyltransferase involved in cell wall biosynthesis